MPVTAPVTDERVTVIVAAARDMLAAHERVTEARARRDRAIVELAGAGWTPGRIARASGMSTSNVRAIVRFNSR